MIEFSQQKVRQYLVHSFLYYQLGESIISDMQYDQNCVEVETYFLTNSKSNVLYNIQDSNPLIVVITTIDCLYVGST